VLIRTLGEAEFRKLGVRFRRAGNGAAIRKQLTKRLRAQAAEDVRAVQAAVKAADSHGVGGGGTRRREAAYRTNRPKGRLASFGLRESIARTIKSRVKYSGFTVGLRIYSDTRSMTNRQRSLPAYFDDSKGWRHPVFGDRDTWAHQYGTPFFERTLRPRTPKQRQAVIDAVNDALKELQ